MLSACGFPLVDENKTQKVKHKVNHNIQFILLDCKSSQTVVSIMTVSTADSTWNWSLEEIRECIYIYCNNLMRTTFTLSCLAVTSTLFFRRSYCKFIGEILHCSFFFNQSIWTDGAVRIQALVGDHTVHCEHVSDK